MTTLTLIRRFNAVAEIFFPDLGARLARRVLMRPRRLPAQAWEQGALEQAERLQLRCGVAAFRWGSPQAPLVLMLHGWEGRPTQFARLIPPLLEAGRQVIAIEGPAHGQSPEKEANVILFAQTLLKVAAELGEVETVIGHSMGGGAVGYAMSLGLRAQRVVLLGAPSSLSRVLERFAQGLALPPRIRARFMERVHRHTGVHPDDVDVARLAQRYRVPALVVHDRRDPVIPYAEGQAIARHWPRAQLMSTEGLGHWRILSDEAVVQRVTAFVRGGPALARVA